MSQKEHDTAEKNAETARPVAQKRSSLSGNKRRTLLILLDVVCFILAYIVATVLIAVVDEQPVGAWLDTLLLVWPNVLIMLAIVLLGRWALNVYGQVWRYPNVRAYLSLVVSDACSGILALLITYVLQNVTQAEGLFVGFWNSFCTVVLFVLSTLVMRFCYQFLYQQQNMAQKVVIKAEDAADVAPPENGAESGEGHEPRNKIGIAIVGAGQVGCHLADELRANPAAHYRPICFIDNSKDKIGYRVADLKVYAEDEHIFEKLKNLPVQEIFVAIPELDAAESARLIRLYSDAGYKVKRYDFPVWDALSMADPDTQMRRVVRDFRIEDLLGRESLEKKINSGELKTYYKDRVVLVTGGGGSIGSEICRQIAKCKPKKLIILDIYENNAYDIQQELIRKYGDELDLAVEIASVRDVIRLESVFQFYRPQVVFHAAAHKHVPLMEHSGCEAIKNNVMGTYNTANMAEKYGAEKFVLISTDKAVNPTNVMGASKRMCEMVVQCRRDSKTTFAAVRFGNVLGSNGSVIPLFKSQIEMGGPITITDHRIIRYFMTIPEASRLVLLAGSMAKDGELFVLDMGKQVKIIDMAENMIRMMGYTPYKDIDIVEIGLRPGEKLYEELLIKTENLTKTDNNLIFIENDAPLTRAAVEEKIHILLDAVKATEQEIASPAIREAFHRVVPTFHEPEDINSKAGEAQEVREANGGSGPETAANAAVCH